MIIRKDYLVIGSIFTAIILIICVVFITRMFSLEQTISEKNEAQLALIQKLDAGIDFQSKQQKYLLETRDIIMKVAKKANVRISLDTAYQVAEANLRYSMKYGIDANFLLAIQTKENRFNIKRVSPAGARGHNQIWEPTGRVVCDVFGWQYSDDLLEDIDKSTRIAAYMIHIFSTTYGKYDNRLELVAAAYNGGPRNAEYYRIKSKKLANETAEYVPSVMEIYKEYVKLTGMYLAVFRSQPSKFSS